MQMFRIVPPGPEGNKRTSAGPGGNDTGMDDALPLRWRLPDADGRMHELG